MDPEEHNYAMVDETVIVLEFDDEPEWFAPLRRSLNRQHHSLAALHRKVDTLGQVGEDLTASIAALEEKETAVETAVSAVATEVSATATAFVDLEKHVEDLVNAGVLTTEQAEALKGRVDNVGTKLGNAAMALTEASTTLATDAAGGEAAAGGAPAGGGGGAAEKPLYNFTGDPANVDLALWTKADVQGAGGVGLFTFNADTAGGAPTGEGNGWTVWTQPTEAVPAA